MKRLICFASEFSLMPSRLIFQHGSENPKEKPAEHHEISKEEAGKNLKIFNARRNRTNQPKFAKIAMKARGGGEIGPGNFGSIF